MGTRADFYVGKGKDAEWLGSIAWDGYREGISESILAATSEQFYRKAVADFLAERNDGTTPDMGWPWPWDDSGTTDCSYWFFDGKVWDATGRPEIYTPCTEEAPDQDEDEDAYEAWREGKERVEFPDMSARKNVTFGRRSGLLVIGG